MYYQIYSYIIYNFKAVETFYILLEATVLSTYASNSRILRWHFRKKYCERWFVEEFDKKLPERTKPWVLTQYQYQPKKTSLPILQIPAGFPPLKKKEEKKSQKTWHKIFQKSLPHIKKVACPIVVDYATLFIGGLRFPKWHLFFVSDFNTKTHSPMSPFWEKV